MTPTKMRRAAALVLAALCLTALCGCQLRLTLGDPFSWEDLSKTQEVQVIPGGSGPGRLWRHACRFWPTWGTPGRRPWPY